MAGGKNHNNVSGYKGVFFRKDNGMWRALLGFKSRRISLGQYHTPEDAVDAYDRGR